jgi:DNA-binding NarL/FixJ family response regulator
VSVKVLIADDNAVIRRSLRSLIENHPRCWVCGEAENGEVAVEKVEELHPDVVILDLQMPVMNGLEAARRISFGFPDTLILMVTMYSGEQLLSEARSAGAQDVLSKTCEISKQLLASLDQACVGR